MNQIKKNLIIIEWKNLQRTFPKKYNVQVKGNYNFLLTQCEKREMLDAQHLLKLYKKLLKN